MTAGNDLQQHVVEQLDEMSRCSAELATAIREGVPLVTPLEEYARALVELSTDMLELAKHAESYHAALGMTRTFAEEREPSDGVVAIDSVPRPLQTRRRLYVERRQGLLVAHDVEDFAAALDKLSDATARSCSIAVLHGRRAELGGDPCSCSHCEGACDCEGPR